MVKTDDFNFEIVNFPFLDGDVPRSLSYGVYISQLIRFARVCSNFQSSGLCVQSPSIIPVPGYPLCLVPHLRSLDDRFSYPVV